MGGVITDLKTKSPSDYTKGLFVCSYVESYFSAIA